VSVESNGVPVPFRTLEAGFWGGPDTPVGVLVARTEPEWRLYWRELNGEGGSPRPAPALDWAAEMAVGYAPGIRPSGGYQARIERIVVRQGALEVHVVEVQPGRGVITTDALTNPYHVVAAAARSEPPRLIERIEVFEFGEE
jgi:hypothetical protein